MLPERQRKLGEHAEDRFRCELVAARGRGEIQAFCRPEWIVFPTHGDVYAVEVKGQEIFEPPPFYGHGIPLRQVRTYQAIHRLLGIRTKLVVYDPAGVRYEAWLDELEARRPELIYDTSIGSRRVYEIDGFRAERLAA